MSDMYLTKKERRKIYIEATIYILSIFLASYLVVCDNIFIRMVPVLYILGIIGRRVFNKPIITSILGFFTILAFGFIINTKFDVSVLLLAVYSLAMIIAGEFTGYIINELYQNFKLRKFIKHYTKIGYIVALFFLIGIPLYLNNMVNSNAITYMSVKGKIESYVAQKYSANYDITKVHYIPAFSGGMYEFSVEVNAIMVELDYVNGETVDVNMAERAEAYDHIEPDGRTKTQGSAITEEVNSFVNISNYSNIKIDAKYDYSEVKLLPDIIRINIEATDENIDDIVKIINDLKTWEKFDMVARINVTTPIGSMSISINELKNRRIDAEYIQNGLKQEPLGDEGGM